jgi:hypothetical protein
MLTFGSSDVAYQLLNETKHPNPNRHPHSKIERHPLMVLHCREPVNGAKVVAEILEDLAYEKKQGPGVARLGRQNSLALQRSLTARGTSRLRDAVVYGYIMQRHALQETVGGLPPRRCGFTAHQSFY